MLKIQGCDLKVSESVVLSFDVDADELIRSLNKPEVKELVEAIVDQHGFDAFENYAEDMAEHFGLKGEK